MSAIRNPLANCTSHIYIWSRKNKYDSPLKLYNMKEQKGNETTKQTLDSSDALYTAVVSVTNKYSLLVVFLCLALEVHGVSVSMHIWGNVSTTVMCSSPPLPLHSTSLMFPRHPSRSVKRYSWPERNDRLLDRSLTRAGERERDDCSAEKHSSSFKTYKNRIKSILYVQTILHISFYFTGAHFWNWTRY